MNKINGIDNETRQKLKDAYMNCDLGVNYTRERFEEALAAGETARMRKYRQRRMLKAALVCMMLCAACTGLLFGFVTWEGASADKDNETKVVEQGGNMIIGSGIAGEDTVGMTVEEYASIEDLPEEIREKAHFIRLENIKAETIRYVQFDNSWAIDVNYIYESNNKVITNESYCPKEKQKSALDGSTYLKKYNNIDIYFQKQRDGISYYMCFEEIVYRVFTNNNNLKIETILDGLY
ncbi:MAG: hypothetical protein IKW01_01045 [Firmicutes bacterium]|nr:hypothetical protein [Bacillota bacterium]